jgi:hypothetical protein
VLCCFCVGYVCCVCLVGGVFCVVGGLLCWGGG